jgi:competence protein ComEC
MMIITTAAIWTAVENEKVVKTAEIAEKLNLLAWEEVIFTGTVHESGYTSSGRKVYIMDVVKTKLPGSAYWHRAFRVRVYSDGPAFAMSGVKSDTVVRVYSFPERRNPHEFDFGGWLLKNGMAAHGEIIQVLNSESEVRFGWETLRKAVNNNIEQVFSESTRRVAKALLLGYKQEIDEETRRQFSRSGLAHIMAVSGLHVGFIVLPFWILIPFMWGSRWGRISGLFILTLLLTGYAGLTGFSPSVSRASLMAWLITYGKLFNKPRNSINLTASAAIILLMINPEQLYSIGFQLSFSAVFIILLVMPEAKRIIPEKYRYQITGKFAGIALVSLVVQAGLYPILITYFGEFSIAGPIANAAVIPLLAITVPAGLALAILPVNVSSMLTFVAFPVELSLTWVKTVAETIGQSRYSYIETSLQSPLIFILWVLGILFIASLRIPEVRTKVLILFIVALNALFIDHFLKHKNQNTLTVTVLDVGQGDAIHIETPNGKNLLIDTGWWSPTGNSGERTVLPYLQYKRVRELDSLILTHPHADHIGGVEPILKNMPVGVIYQSSYPYNSGIYNRYRKLAGRKEIPIRNTYAGDTIKLDDDLRIYVLGPIAGGSLHSNPNNHSVVVKVVYGEVSFLLTGDAETEQERNMAIQYGDFLRSTVYKMGHHGSRTSSTATFLNYVRPNYSVASLAFHNRFHHPGQNAIMNVSKYTSERHFTSLDGAVIFVTDGKDLETKKWNHE